MALPSGLQPVSLPGVTPGGLPGHAAAPAAPGLGGLAPVALKPQRLVLMAASDGRRVGLQLAYSDGLGKRLGKAGAVWFAPRRMWVVELGAATSQDKPDPERQAARLMTWLDGQVEGDYDEAGAHQVVRAAIVATEATYFTQLLDVQIFPLVEGGFAVSFQYDLPMVKAMRSLGGRFHKFASAWEVRGAAPAILAAIKAVAGVDEEFVFVHERPLVLEQLAAAPASEVPIKVPGAAPSFGEASTDEEGIDKGAGFLSAIAEPSGVIDVDEDALAAEATAAGLRDYQVVGVRHLLRQDSSCLGDDMGLGKTRQTVVAARMAAASELLRAVPPESAGSPVLPRVLVLCPASLRINWQREINAVYPNDLVGMVGQDRMEMLHGCRWVVANYERLGGLVREMDLHFQVMVVDEAHYLKEHMSGRTRNAFVLACRIPRRFLVTGTPLLSREIELHTLLRLSGHRLGSLRLNDFRKRFTGSRERRAELASELRGWLLRRRKDVLKDLGTKDRQVRHLSPAEGLAGYREILADMTLGVMPKIVKLRQTLEALKLQFIVEAIESRSAGDKFIVFCEYMGTVKALKAALAALGVVCVTLVGSDAPAARQRSIDAFQQDPDTTVFITTTAAGGVGITLTAANIVLFASLPWTPALMRQAEDRAYRLGQKRDVLVLVPLVDQTIDQQIWALLASKTALEQDVVEAVCTQVDTKATKAVRPRMADMLAMTAMAE
jgi:superfamily II DNA or RNA helicase